MYGRCPLRFPHNTMFGSFLLPVVNIGVFTSYLRYLGLFAYRGVQHILWCVFVLFFFVALHDGIISLRGEVLAHKTSLFQTFFIKCLSQARKVSGHVRSIEFSSSFYYFSIEFWNCSECMVFSGYKYQYCFMPILL
jgi:hypothetical protein